ncbi:amino acid ABC transporter substrate-binding protein [Neolewinella aurantiaca]|uniref:Amino acid ABC transporter substrate-binding protein n=1 Tax=Neolewinella aurantiaca TaxID=2602767 RepID=A0A5C7FL44_9BACT|nr:ABC transporter substrate-binding protein [Neolewinella aurantiaca]TXF91417.1 amino acid ABC transporter substrate-binding protein [Neolewinella aurantiaca]
MISVPNRRPPLSGNNLSTFVALALLLVFVSSCELFKPAVDPGTGQTTGTDESRREQEGEDLDPVQSRRVYDPATGTYIYVANAPTDKMDTVRWTTVSEDRNPPIVEEGGNDYIPDNQTGVDTNGETGMTPVSQVGTTPEGSRLLNGYNVDFVLPFLTDRYLGSEDKVDANSQWSLHFYSGAKLALDDMRGAANVNYNVNVQDSRASEARVQSIAASPEFSQSQVVIGPYLKNNVSALAEAARGKETVLISPYSASGGITEKNPNYVQVNPTLETHMRSLLQHAYKTQGADRIVLVTGMDPNQKTRLGYIQDEYKILTGNAQIEPLEEVQVDMNDANTSLRDYLRGRKTVFIVPIYEDESFVANFLRVLYSETRDDFGQNVAVYGLPQWIDFTRINFDYYEGTNVHVSSSVFIDKLNPAVREFRRKFFERYAALPRDEAYVGYDVTRYFLRMAAEHGTRFQYALEANPEDLMHTRFRFQPVAVVPAGATNFEQATLDRFENKFVNILRFRDYSFKRVN